MGISTLIGLWMVIQQPRPDGGITEPMTIAYYFDKSDCFRIAASNQRWECVKRPEVEKARESKNKRLK
jgi:hypothetical protein